MLKKIFATVFVLSIFLIQSSAMAGGYQKYLNGDRNYILYDGHMGTAWYVVRGSLRVEADKYPAAVLSIVSAQVNNAYDGATTVTSQIRLFFVYDRDKREAVWIKSQDDYLILKRDASRAGGSAMVKAAEMAYYLATSGEKFFGFSSDFYPDL